MITKQDDVITMIKSKYENVATALYLVTNHLKDTEPLKHKVRQISHDILEHMIHLSDTSYVQVENHTAHLQSLLRIASSAGLIAEQNASILSDALQKTLKDMQQYMKSLTNMSISLSDLLYIEEPELGSDAGTEDGVGSMRGTGNQLPHGIRSESESRPDRSDAEPKKHHKSAEARESHKLPSENIPKMSFDGVASMHQAFNAINKNAVDVQDQPKVAIRPAGGISDRQQIIINELRNKGQLTVKDLAEKIKDCSEKTIQRELLSLVGSGVLRKEGERRWSRYSVK